MYGKKLRKRPPPRELFFAPLEMSLDPNNLESVSYAYESAKAGHAKQTRLGGARYFDHPKAAAWIYINELKGRDPRIIIALLLHDVQEDTALLSTYRICRNFGEDIALDLRAITKLRKGVKNRIKETEEQYICRITETSPHVIIVKLCDRLHNLRTLDACPSEKQIKYLEETKTLLMPVLLNALRSHKEDWSILADTLEKEMKKAVLKAEGNLKKLSAKENHKK